MQPHAEGHELDLGAAAMALMQLMRAGAASHSGGGGGSMGGAASGSSAGSGTAALAVNVEAALPRHVMQVGQRVDQQPMQHAKDGAAMRQLCCLPCMSCK